MLSPIIRSTAGLLAALAIFAPCGVQAQLVRQQNTTLNLPADLPVATGYTTENALGALTFQNPMLTTFPAGETNRLFVAERAGTIQCVSSLSGVPTKTAYLSLSSLLPAGEAFDSAVGENGFLSMVFHPNFATNRTFYVYFSMRHTASGQYFQRLHQVTVTSASANTATIQQHKPLLTIVDRDTNHNGGDLHFGADGFLYLSTGDEGASNDSRNNARHINHRNVTTPVVVQRTGFWGQMLRLAVEVDPVGQPGVFPTGAVAPNAHVQTSTAYPSAVQVGNYRVPADNPFHGYTLWHSVAIDPLTVRTEIWATGLRNPFRWSFDPVTGRLFLGDVGQLAREEVDIVAKGDDMGWSWREGAIAFNSSQPYPDSSPGNTNAAPPPPAVGAPPGTGFSPKAPIYDYDRTNNGTPNDPVVYGVSITGGVVYRGNRLTELYGKYLFAEYNNGFIVALTENAGVWTGERLATDNGIVDFGYDPRNGDAIFCDLSGSMVKRLARTGTSGTPPPATLSATGAFSNPTTLTPNAGIVPYAPNVSFWSDYAIKSRWFSIKNLTDTVGFSADAVWTLPTGMVWVKHFDFDTTRGNPATRRKLETRFLVKTATDVYGLSYKWRADQTDADLVAEDGLTEVIATSSPAQTWRYPSRAECRVCHTQPGGYALSFNTRQMNAAHLFGAQTQNQITALSSAGYFAAPVTGVHSLPAFAPADDATKSREHRVRSYLAVNCVQCHQPGGPAVGNWDARPTIPTDSANLISGVLVNSLGDAANLWAVPGDAPALIGTATHSMVLKRLRGDGVPRMPPLATSERDLAAEQLLRDWINLDLPSRLSLAQWQTLHFGSPGATNAALTADPDKDGQRNDLEFMTGSDPMDAAGLWTPTLQTAGSNYQLTFPHTAKRAFLIETSTDLQAWSLWDVPDNKLEYRATTLPRTVTGPMDASAARFFRFRILDQ